MFFFEIIECLTKATCRYATQIKENNTQVAQAIQSSTTNSSSSNPNITVYRSSSSDLYKKLITSTNNLEKVRESIKSFLTDLEFYKYHSVAEKQDKLKLYEINKAQLETLLNNSSEFIIQIIEQTLEIIASNKVNF